MKINRINIFIVTFCLVLLISCEKWVDIKEPTNLIGTEVIFGDTNSVKTLIGDMYFQMSSGAGGHFSKISLTSAFICDELKFKSGSTIPTAYAYIEPYYCNYSSSSTVFSNWNSWYNPIFQANVLLEHLPKVNNVNFAESKKREYTGVAHTIRALKHYDLARCYGDVPLIKSTDINLASATGRNSQSEVFGFVIEDLNKAIDELPSTKGAVQFINCKYQAHALLARVYLQTDKWSEAESAATSVISSGLYSIESDLNKVFKRGSKEIIFALGDYRASGNVYNGRVYMIYNMYYNFQLSNLTSANLNYIAGATVQCPTLSDQFMNSFESSDKRSVDGNWVKKYIYNSYDVVIPYKYKVSQSTLDNTLATTSPEDEVWIRLAEMYLIRAEARAMQNKISEAAADLNVIRNRAGLANTTASDKTTMLTAIENERWHELFLEGHRFFDLSRTGKLDAVISSIPFKAENWAPHKKFWPIPVTYLFENPWLKQTTGY